MVVSQWRDASKRRLVPRERADQDDGLHFLEDRFLDAVDTNGPRVMTAIARHREDGTAAREERGFSISAAGALEVNARFRN